MKWGLMLTTMAVLGFSASANAKVVEPQDVKIVENMRIEQSLTGQAGDPEKGREWFVNRKLGNCLACHANAELAHLPFHGEVGPQMDGVADRWSEAELRAIVVNAKLPLGDHTIMPRFYVVDPADRIAKKFAGKTILSAEQVEDVVAYLMTLKE